MSYDVEKTLIVAQGIVEQLLVGAAVESFGIMNQTLFIDFRDDDSEDNRLIINSLISLSGYKKPESLDEIEYALLCMKKINLHVVERVECKQNQELVLYFANDAAFSLFPDERNIEEDQWQLNSSLHIAEGGKSVIALVGGGYATW